MKSDMKKLDSVVVFNGMKVKEFAEIIERIEMFQRDLNINLSNVQKDVVYMKECKVDQSDYQIGFKNLTENVETIKYAS